MKKLIKTDSYLLLIDKEAEIKKGNYYFANQGVMFCSKVRDGSKYPYLNQYENYDSIHWKGVIVAYYPLTKEAKELDLPQLPNPFKDYSLNRAKEFVFNKFKETFEKYPKGGRISNDAVQDVIKVSVETGYKFATKSAQPKQFSLEDMIAFSEYVGSYYANIHKPVIPTEELLNNFIQSLSTQQLPKEFVGWLSKIKCPYDFTSRCTIDRCDCEFVFETITNSEGKEVLVGTYKY